jgi:transposase
MQRMGRAAGRVVIGMDPHKRSATIEVIDDDEKVLAQGRYDTDTDGYQTMLAAGRQFPDRVWAVEGCTGIGRHIAQRLVADGETVLDVPAKLSARVRVFDTGQGRKTDSVDAHSVAAAGLRSPRLRQIQSDDTTVALRLMVDRRAELGRARTEVVNRIHKLLLEILPGGAKKFLTRGRARYLLRTAPAPVGIVAQTRHQLAREVIDELTIIDAKIRAADKHLRQLVTATGSSLHELNGIGPSGAARLIGDIGDIARFRTAAHFASWNGTAPIEASSGDQRRHRLSRAGNRRINRVLHIMAVVKPATTPPAAPTTGAVSPKARPPWKRSARSNATSPTSSTSGWSATPNKPATPGPAREDTRERLCNPARTAQSPSAASSDKSQPGPATGKGRTLSP